MEFATPQNLGHKRLTDARHLRIHGRTAQVHTHRRVDTDVLLAALESIVLTGEGTSDVRTDVKERTDVHGIAFLDQMGGHRSEMLENLIDFRGTKLGALTLHRRGNILQRLRQRRDARVVDWLTVRHHRSVVPNDIVTNGTRSAYIAIGFSPKGRISFQICQPHHPQQAASPDAVTVSVSAGRRS